ncbi:hypothetical protein [Candidatus Tisiphia endosymbiont of Temnostethus pusillus]|uniref:hypothetical protein n=1 Tax=Candidatus Tisiphia endosymbiont of Temnostethus pusillus TaxID=3139335 RepID=UPI0035C88782
MALASLLPKPGSGAGGSNSILLLSSAMQQPIYVFENGKFLQSYGKGLGGTPITIGYDSKNQQYFGFTNKGSSNSGSIFEAISASSNGKYSANILQSIACPASTSSGTPLFPPPTLPKSPSGSASGGQPIYSFNTVGSGEIVLPPELLGKPVPSITVPKDVIPSNKATADPSEFKWTEEGVAHLLAASKSKDNTLMQQAYAIGGDMGSIPRLVAPMEGRKTTADTDRNISEYFDNPNNKYANNQIIKGIAQAGEAIELAGSNLAYGISCVEGGLETLLAVGTVVGGVVDGVKDVAKGVAKSVLSNDAYENAAKNYNKLPRGAKIATEFVGDCGILGGVGKVAKLAGGEVINAFKGAAAEGSILRSVAGASEISTGLGENVPTKPIPLEIKPTASILSEVGDLGLAEFESNAIIQEIVGTKPMISGTSRELAALYAKLASQEQGTVIAGVGHARPINDINRYNGLKKMDKKIE